MDKIVKKGDFMKKIGQKCVFFSVKPIFDQVGGVGWGTNFDRSLAWLVSSFCQKSKCQLACAQKLRFPSTEFCIMEKWLVPTGNTLAPASTDLGKVANASINELAVSPVFGCLSISVDQIPGLSVFSLTNQDSKKRVFGNSTHVFKIKRSVITR